MKILFITPYTYPKKGGVENYVWNIALGLKKMYLHDVVIIASNPFSKDTTEEIDGIKIYKLKPSLKLSNTPIGFNWHTRISNIIEKEKPDIINGHTPVPFISDISASIAKKKNIPYILTYHNDLVKNTFVLNLIISTYYKLAGINTLKLAQKVVVTSDFYKEKSKILSKFLSKTIVISPGVDLLKYRLTPVSTLLKKRFSPYKVILFVGQLEHTYKHKGLKYLLESLILIKKEIKEIKLIIIGKGDMIDDYKKIVLDKGLTNNVTFLTNVNDTQLIQYYKVSEALVLPSINDSEGFGMVLIEAGAAHKPVIATKVGGIPYVVDKTNGILVDPKDSQSLSKAILTLFSDSSLSRQLGERNYMKVKEKFTWDLQVKKTNMLIKDLL